MSLTSALIKQLERFGDKEIIIEKDRSWKLSEIANVAIKLSFIIAEKDKSKYKNVAILFPNSVAFVIAYFSVLFAGRTVVPLNCLLKPPELSNLLTNCEPELLITSQIFSSLIEALSAQLTRPLTVLYVEELFRKVSTAGGEGLKTPPPVAENDIACILYTSGTVGNPKGVMLTHKNLLSNVESCRRWLEVVPEDAFLCALPLFHSFGMTTTFLLPILSGAKMVMFSQYNPAAALELVVKENISALLLVPAWFYLLVEQARNNPPELSSVRFCVSGGGTLSPELETLFPQVFGLRLHNGYGLTEASPVVSTNRPQDYKKGSIGKPIPDVSVSIWDSAEKELAPGEVGEIMVKGPNVMPGYFQMPEETAQTITPDGWLYTGDLGYIDEEGFLYITGRKKELIIVSGKNVFPQEVETVLMQYPGVLEAAVIGASEPKRGEQVVAFLRLKEGVAVSEKELRHHCGQKLADYKIPRRFVFVNEFPKNPLGKIQKFLLK